MVVSVYLDKISYFLGLPINMVEKSKKIGAINKNYYF